MVVIQDARGCHRSDATFEAFVNEEQDGHDTVAWILEQHFSDGNVFMYGGSASAPPDAPAVSTPPGYEESFRSSPPRRRRRLGVPRGP